MHAITRTMMSLATQHEVTEIRPQPSPTAMHLPAGAPSFRIRGHRLDRRIACLSTTMARMRVSRIEIAGRIHDEIDPLDLGYSRTSVFSKEELGISLRSFQDADRLSRAIATHPLLRAVLESGLVCESRILEILPALDGTNDAEWIRNAYLLTSKQLKQLLNERRQCRHSTTNPGPDPGLGPGGLDSAVPEGTWRLDLECPARFRWILDAFSENVARRTAVPAGHSRALEVLLAEFQASGNATVRENPSGTDRSYRYRKLEAKAGMNEPVALDGIVVTRLPTEDVVASGMSRLSVLDELLASASEPDPVSASVSELTTREAAPSHCGHELLREFRAIEAKLRTLRSQLASLLYEVRTTQAWRSLGFDSFGHYVEDRLGVTVRTANLWIRDWQTRTRTLHEADSDQELRTSSVLVLSRIDRAGANDSCMQLWWDRARTVTTSVLEDQVRWALAHDELRPPEAGSFPAVKQDASADDLTLEDVKRESHNPRLAPPPLAAWPAIAARLLSAPELISLPEFHEAAAIHKSSVAGGGPASAEVADNLLGKISARFGKISARQWKEIFRVPDPREKCTTMIRVHLDRDLLDSLNRSVFRMRTAYGDDMPVWWCLEVMILHVLNGWTAEDRDFRRRTAEFDILARDGFQCASPRCNARTQLNVHHIVYRSRGGTNDPSNLTTLCAACHLQGVHTRGTITVAGQAPERLRWSFGQSSAMWSSSAPLTGLVRPTGARVRLQHLSS